MDIRALRYFTEVVRQQSFTRAAEKLFVTQPTISKMMKHLEDELGMPLFIREGRSFRLTDAGRVAFDRGQDVMAAMNRMKAEMADLVSLERGELVVGLPPMSGGAFLAPVVSAFREQYPNIELKMVEDGALAIENSVRTGQLEIGAAVLPVDSQTFEQFGFVRDPLCVVAPAGSPWQGKQSVKLADVADWPIVFYPEDFTLSRRILDGFAQLGKPIRIAGRSAHWDFIVAMVNANLGIALLPRSVADRLESWPFDVVQLDEDQIVWSLGLIWQKDVYLSHAARAWIQVTQDVLGKMP
ncbi:MULTISPECIES: LysR family transcriptional regulator [unclassified Paludibacterium]|uniref:LysR family transcriptional regulator n=1 Tax=unclassified Paludibacterium TaxID=2618429 RepID=UPI001C050FF0|nr:LysR family transcriptional regulator [Paludibacterium sp. B53371]BEV73685.1 LysR family transcriptional regulator [Paludibacterium sp. THUN1379]